MKKYIWLDSRKFIFYINYTKREIWITVLSPMRLGTCIYCSVGRLMMNALPLTYSVSLW